MEDSEHGEYAVEVLHHIVYDWPPLYLGYEIDCNLAKFARGLHKWLQRLPIVDLETGTLKYLGETYSGFNHDTLRLFAKLLQAHPKSIKVSEVFPDESIRQDRIKSSLPRHIAKLIRTERSTGTWLDLPDETLKSG